MTKEPTVNPNRSQLYPPYTPSLDLLRPSRPHEVAPTLIEGRPSPILAPPNPSLDELLELVAGSLQLTVSQYERAKSAYGAVTTWLGAPESELAPFRPQMFPQGSTAIRTNNRPVGRKDHDVDLVCQLMVTGWTPMRVYEAILRRLAAHGTYATMIERKSRCIRLNYETDFHLDIIPAEPAPLLLVSYGAHAVRIPDRDQATWTPSNPLGYIRWFHDQAESARMRLSKRAAAPLPARLGPGDQTVLAMIVQLIKRYRDLEFASPERAPIAPRSIALTTLAATVYDGEQHPARALQQVVTGMVDAVMAAWPARVAIPNPTNPGERFCDKFTSETYAAFVSFLFRMERDVAALVTSTGAGLPDLQARLAVLFGTELAKQAITKHVEEVRRASEEGRLRITLRKGLTVVQSANAPGRVVPNHRPFGSTSTSSTGAR